RLDRRCSNILHHLSSGLLRDPEWRVSYDHQERNESARRIHHQREGACPSRLTPVARKRRKTEQRKDRTRERWVSVIGPALGLVDQWNPPRGGGDCHDRGESR